MSRVAPRSAARQRGAITLLVGLALLAGATTLTISSVRVAFLEQRIANNELRALEVQQAAQAGLEYALATLWQGADPGDSAPEIGATGDYRYAIALEVENTPGCKLVRSEATAISDASIRAVAFECFQQKTMLNPGFAGPLAPIVIDGSLSNVKSNANAVYPRDCGGAPQAECQKIAISSSAPLGDIESGKLDLNGGTIQPDAFAAGTVWEQVFSISKTEFQALAATDPRFMWVTSTSNWHASVGSPSAPVYLVFAASSQCPKVNGSPVIYGIVFFEGTTSCSNQGWGGATIYGSVVFDGPLTVLTANSSFHHWSHAASDDDRADINPVSAASRVPGTWRDWE